jgi:hypothetical protein
VRKIYALLADSHGKPSGLPLHSLKDAHAFSKVLLELYNALSSIKKPGFATLVQQREADQ